MNHISSRRRRPLLVVVLALVLSLVGIPAATAGQGAPPTTDLTGYTDTAADQAPPSFQQGCLPAGGQAIADPEIPDGDFVVVGGGWGHGAGMSQYGAQGAGRLGCSAEQILTTYFPGTALGTVAMPERVVIGLGTGVTSTRITAEAGTIPWELCHYQTGECTDIGAQQAPGAVWTVTILSDARYRITDASGALVFEGGSFELNLRALLSPTTDVDRRVGVSTTGHTYRWGVLQIDSVQSAASDAFLTIDIPSMDLYLRGLAEVPASWPAGTLQAQAISGRSYATNRITRLGIRDSCRCNLLSTPADQNYEGYDYESADARGGGSWRAAVEATSATVLLADGAIAETFYSSSHGGHSESSAFVFGGALSYVQPVDDSRWDLASSNPLRRWTKPVSAADLGAAAGVGTATAVELLEPRGAAGRVGNPARGWGGVRITGTSGSAVLSGDQVKSRLGLRSTLFDIRVPGGQSPAPGPQPQPEPEPTSPPPADTLRRLSGSDRIGTAIAVSAASWDTAPDVVVAAADRFPDALAGVKLAASLGAPLLLTGRDTLPDAVQAEIRRLGAKTAWLLGGTGAIATSVRGDLADMGLTTRRISGPDRFATAGAIAVAASGTADEVTLALGDDWPDAVSASSLAALVDGPPTLLVQRDAVPDATVQALRDLGATRATIVGGTAVIGQAVVDRLQALGLSVTRLSGPNRFATAAAVAEAALARGAAPSTLVVASGGGFADALSAGAAAGRLGGVLVLAPTSRLSDGAATGEFVQANRSRLTGGIVVGGTGAISAGVEQEIEALLQP